MSEQHTPKTTEEKSAVLFKHGFLRDQDRRDTARIEARWRLYKSVPQKIIRSAKQKEPAVKAA